MQNKITRYWKKILTNVKTEIARRTIREKDIRDPVDRIRLPPSGVYQTEQKYISKEDIGKVVKNLASDLETRATEGILLEDARFVKETDLYGNMIAILTSENPVAEKGKKIIFYGNPIIRKKMDNAIGKGQHTEEQKENARWAFTETVMDNYRVLFPSEISEKTSKESGIPVSLVEKIHEFDKKNLKNKIAQEEICPEKNYSKYAKESIFVDIRKMTTGIGKILGSPIETELWEYCIQIIDGQGNEEYKTDKEGVVSTILKRDFGVHEDQLSKHQMENLTSVLNKIESKYKDKYIFVEFEDHYYPPLEAMELAKQTNNKIYPIIYKTLEENKEPYRVKTKKLSNLQKTAIGLGVAAALTAGAIFQYNLIKNQEKNSKEKQKIQKVIEKKAK